MKLEYQAYDRSGQLVSDSIEAADEAQATEKLRRQGLYVTEIKESSGAAAVRAAGKRIGAGRRLRCLTTFAKQLHVLVATGTPLVQALGALERQIKEPQWRAVIEQMRRQVEEGASMSQAMAEHPQYFDSVARSLIAAGESSGNFDAMLERLAMLSRKELHVRSSIVGAMVYPSLLIVVAVSVLVVMLTFVLPRFTSLFESLDTPLPPTTQFLMFLSGILISYWWAVLGGGVATFFGLRTFLRTDSGKRSTDTAMLRLPQIGTITRSFATARVTRLLGVLLQGKVPLLEALNLTRTAAGNWHYAALLVRAEEAVTRGESISSVFADNDLVHPSVYEALRNGERSGQIGPLLINIAEFLDEENEVIVRSLTSIIEPLILIVLGALVGLVALSMFMPLFDLTAMASGGG